MTTIRIDDTAIGREAARFLIERIEGHPAQVRVRDIGFSVVVRESA